MFASMLKRLDWDSNFFNYEIGKLVLSSSDNFEFDRFKLNSLSYKLVYIYSEEVLNCKKLSLVDTKLTFLKEIIDIEIFNDKHLTFFDTEKDDFSALEALALSSGKYSRFKLDDNFKNHEYENLYKRWIRNLVYEDKTADIILYKKNNNILGFTTLEKNNKSLCNIGLIAVDNRSRGQRIGTKMINFTIAQAYKRGFEKIQVVTQLENKPAMNLYKKCDFILDKTDFIYHFWNL